MNLSDDEQSSDVKDLLREALPPWAERRMKATPGSKPCGPPAGRTPVLTPRRDYSAAVASCCVYLRVCVQFGQR